ncbi:prostaglandin E2 receptor EP3 subtype [Cydia pomonella]|uniref:prostaglandin E2 receptor EP3 subtype n=1 Tax=Cydia pomonella TaxID=82600 RepID=UPI002ADD40C7|nr:prostaglandin E2 receptor EP3 subtype [Cydia pomonella]XP_061729590.1 prostaglandin E2 receptor EP3 subtype [Cydia pomonella]
MDITTLSPEDFTEYNFLNESLHFENGTSEPCASPQVGKIFSIILKVVYVTGILGNGIAIVCLRKGERRVRNRKHLLLLTSLACNDIVALVGMMASMVVAETIPWVRATRAYCAIRVVLRVFGIGSVCIAVTMALERYLALTRPFLYQKQVTYYVIRTALLVGWFWAAVLTCAPVLGLGLYYDESTGGCMRYRNAVETTDVVYAWIYVTFGALLCVILVYCNLAVIRALYEISAPRGAPVMRRVSKSSCRQRAAVPASETGHHNPATAEEVAFSRLMATLSVLFMICWMPQMITSSLYLSLNSRYWPRLAPLGAISDLLMLLNYVLDPVLYVLMRRSRPRCLRALSHALAHCFKRNHKTSTESIKTSCCPQETLLVSDSSGAEMKPLRALPASTPAHLLD